MELLPFGKHGHTCTAQPSHIVFEIVLVTYLKTVA